MTAAARTAEYGYFYFSFTYYLGKAFRGLAVNERV